MNIHNGPNCASIGSAQDALVGVRHSSTLCAAAQIRTVQLSLPGPKGCLVELRGLEPLTLTLPV